MSEKSSTKTSKSSVTETKTKENSHTVTILVAIIAVLIFFIIQQNYITNRETVSIEPNTDKDALYKELKDKIKKEILEETQSKQDVEKVQKVTQDDIINDKKESIKVKKEESKNVIEDKKIDDLSSAELKFQNGKPVILDSSQIKFKIEEPKKEEKSNRKDEKSNKKEEVEEKKVDTKENNLEKKSNVPKEIENFPTKKISEMKTKKMWIPIPNSNGGHRRVPPIEIKFGKEHGSSVKVWLFEEFLSEEESLQLIQAHESHLKELLKQKPIICFDSVSTLKKNLIELKRENVAEIVTPNDFTKGTYCLNQTFSRQLEKWGLKWSYSTAFYPGESKFSKIFGKRIEEATMLNETHGGKFQITSYPPGVGYKSHTDCILETDDQRDRYATFLVYLNELGADGGGETIFPELGIDVKPRQGRALTWNNMNYATGKCESKSIHKASEVKHPVKKKYIIQRWYYYKNFYSLGKRMQESPLPDRPPNTPKVSCDDYDHGSCRMYDEWNPDHMIDYQQNKKIY